MPRPRLIGSPEVPQRTVSDSLPRRGIGCIQDGLQLVNGEVLDHTGLGFLERDRQDPPDLLQSPVDPLAKVNEVRERLTAALSVFAF
jgi:hypothetical protein